MHKANDKLFSRLKQGHIFVVAGDAETAVQAMQVFNRTAYCLDLVNEFAQQLVTQTDGGRNAEQALEITLRFAESFTALYPRGPEQCIADREMFRSVKVDLPGVQ